MITIVGLKPETTYEVKISAINGKGEGESSAPESFKTQPVRKCLSLSAFFSLSPSLSYVPSTLFTHQPPLLSAAADLTTHNASLPWTLLDLTPRRCIACPACTSVFYMWMCVFVLVCVRVFKQFPENCCVTAASHLSSASQLCGAPPPSVLPVPACARQQLCLVSAESCVLC